MQTLFYFDDVKQLDCYESFDILPVSNSHRSPIQINEEIEFWSVMGTLKPEKAIDIEERQFPVADLPSELYAVLFASLCKQVTGAETLER